jgi:hypothetical protein
MIRQYSRVISTHNRDPKDTLPQHSWTITYKNNNNLQKHNKVTIIVLTN